MSHAESEVSRGKQISRGVRASEWLAIRRSLALLHRLLGGPASTPELIASVLDIVGPEAYPEGQKARLAAFKRDRNNLRLQLGATFSYDPYERVYVLHDPGPFGYVELSLASLQAVRLLSQTFIGEVGEQAEIRPLLDELIARLSPEARRLLDSRQPPIDLDVFQEVDASPIKARVWETVHRAVSQRRKLTFNHLSPQRPDRLPRYHEVAPYRIRYQGGHWYLYAYDLYYRSPTSEEEYDSGYRDFRLHYILDDERLAVLPTMIPAAQRRPPRYLVQYTLLPPVGRGEISRHFDDIQVERLPDGSAEVRGFTDDPWKAARLLLAYGENCIVKGGWEVQQRLLEAVEKMARNYGLVE